MILLFADDFFPHSSRSVILLDSLSHRSLCSRAEIRSFDATTIVYACRTYNPSRVQQDKHRRHRVRYRNRTSIRIDTTTLVLSVSFMFCLVRSLLRFANVSTSARNGNPCVYWIRRDMDRCCCAAAAAADADAIIGTGIGAVAVVVCTLIDVAGLDTVETVRLLAAAGGVENHRRRRCCCC